MKIDFSQRTALVLAAALAMAPPALLAEESPGAAATGTAPRLSLETSAWMVMNLFPDPGDFYQLTLGYRPDERNAIFLNGLTWKYHAPIGIPMTSSDYADPGQDYPGYVRAYGLGLGYQRMIWKGLFAAAFATPLIQDFRSTGGDDLGTGFQLYAQAQAGYEFVLLKGKFFIKPFLSCNWWPINAGFPDSFKAIEDRWPNYFLLEPHLDIGFRF